MANDLTWHWYWWQIVSLAIDIYGKLSHLAWKLIANCSLVINIYGKLSWTLKNIDPLGVDIKGNLSCLVWTYCKLPQTMPDAFSVLRNSVYSHLPHSYASLIKFNTPLLIHNSELQDSKSPMSISKSLNESGILVNSALYPWYRIACLTCRMLKAIMVTKPSKTIVYKVEIFQWYREIH